MIRIPVTEQSQVADARRQVNEFVKALGFDETQAGKLAIVVTELATNLIKHGRGGELLAQKAARSGTVGIELLSLDRGPGMASIEDSMRDGFSTAGSKGEGLGAVRRQAAEFDVWSQPGQGTALLARFWPGRTPPAGEADAKRLHVGAVSVSKPGEDVCGDGWNVMRDEAGIAILVVDGLGHGPQAAEAALAATRLFEKYGTRPVPDVLESLHHGLRGTRGAAVAVARLQPATRKIAYGGIGNIAATFLTEGAVRRGVSQSGTAGVVARRISEFQYSHGADLIAVLHSDGIGTSWSLDRYAGLTARDPTLMAAVLYRDFARGSDDATVVVARWAA